MAGNQWMVPVAVSITVLMADIVEMDLITKEHGTSMAYIRQASLIVQDGQVVSLPVYIPLKLLYFIY